MRLNGVRARALWLTRAVAINTEARVSNCDPGASWLALVVILRFGVCPRPPFTSKGLIANAYNSTWKSQPLVVEIPVRSKCGRAR